MEQTDIEVIEQIIKAIGKDLSQFNLGQLEALLWQVKVCFKEKSQEAEALIKELEPLYPPAEILGLRPTMTIENERYEDVKKRSADFLRAFLNSKGVKIQ